LLLLLLVVVVTHTLTHTHTHNFYSPETGSKARIKKLYYNT